MHDYFGYFLFIGLTLFFFGYNFLQGIKYLCKDNENDFIIIVQDKLTEFFRPWKIATLSIGVLLLILGSFYIPAPDWDIPISFIMAFFTYLTAGWSVRVVLFRRWRFFPLMLFYIWWSVDGCYALYWSLVAPEALELMRDANFFASLSLYLTCGLIWCYNGDIKSLFSEVKRRLLNQN